MPHNKLEASCKQVGLTGIITENLKIYKRAKMNEEEFRIYLKTVINKRGNKFENSKIDEFIDDLKNKISRETSNINLLDINDIPKLELRKKQLSSSSFNQQEGNGRPSNAI